MNESLFQKYVAKFSERPFLWEKNLDTDQWEPTTYAETLVKAKRVAAGLMALGVQKGEKTQREAGAGGCL